jgi:nucleoporin GLE1
MDLLLAELHRACIYTVPKHIIYSKVTFINSKKLFINVLVSSRYGDFEFDVDHVLRTILHYLLVELHIEGEAVNSRSTDCVFDYQQKKIAFRGEKKKTAS